MTQTLSSVFSRVEFIFFLNSPDERRFIDAHDRCLFASETKTFRDILDGLATAARDSDFIIFSETNLFSDAVWVDALIRTKTAAIVPQCVLALTETNEILYFDQKRRHSDAEYKSQFAFFFGLPKNIFKIDADKYSHAPFDDLRESLLQLFRAENIDLSVVADSYLFCSDDSGSIAEIINASQRCAFFAPPTQPSAEKVKPSLAIDLLRLERAHRQALRTSLSEGEVAKIKSAMRIDSRWLLLNTERLVVKAIFSPFFTELEFYREAIASLAGTDYLLVLHQLRRGGSEKEALLHLRAYRDLYPDRKVSVVLTSAVEPDLEWQLPGGVKIVEMGKPLAALGLDQSRQSYLLYRLLDQVAPRVLHVKASHIGWGTLKAYCRVLSRKMKILANLYCVEYTPEGRAYSPGFNEMISAAPDISWFLADNQNVLEQLRPLVSTPSTKIYYPAAIAPYSWSKPETTTFRVLWCSRLTYQKDLQTLLRIAFMFKDFEFHVFGEQSDFQKYIDVFAAHENIRFWGLFDSVDELNLRAYDCFLYTSLWDGLPNILLEIGSHGMPIVSPRVGGISELLDKTNSFQYENLGELVAIFSNWAPEIAAKRARALQQKISKIYAWPNFVEQCRQVYE